MPEHSNARSRTDAVVIGRNEGDRLVACLRALAPQVRRLVYVDSGSDDGSPERARAEGAEVIALDPARPFSAARARNAGLAALAGDPPEFVQLQDGDAVPRPAWVARGAAFLDATPRAAAVHGHTAEAAPEASLYNRLIADEWRAAPGETPACTGVVLMRFAPLHAIGGFRDDVIAAEDDEMALRLRAAGWTLHRMDADMAEHDARMLRFGQFWRRAVRAGHGFAQVGDLHPGYFRAERRRAWAWALVLPLVAAVLAPVLVPVLVPGIAALYAAAIVRMAARFRARGFSGRDALGAALLFMASKPANLAGMLRWRLRRWRGAAPRLIEYRQAGQG